MPKMLRSYWLFVTTVWIDEFHRVAGHGLGESIRRNPEGTFFSENWADFLKIIIFIKKVIFKNTFILAYSCPFLFNRAIIFRLVRSIAASTSLSEPNSLIAVDNWYFTKLVRASTDREDLKLITFTKCSTRDQFLPILLLNQFSIDENLHRWIFRDEVLIVYIGLN